MDIFQQEIIERLIEIQRNVNIAMKECLNSEYGWVGRSLQWMEDDIARIKKSLDSL